jgi:hypothetical protein
METVGLRRTISDKGQNFNSRDCVTKQDEHNTLLELGLPLPQASFFYHLGVTHSPACKGGGVPIRTTDEQRSPSVFEDFSACLNRACLLQFLEKKEDKIGVTVLLNEVLSKFVFTTYPIFVRICLPHITSIYGPPLQTALGMDFPPSKSIRPAPYKQQVQ